MGGYVVTGLRDTPLATSAMFDDLGRSKYDPEAFKAFNAESVLLLGSGRQRVWKRGGDRPAPSAPYTVAAGHDVSFDIVLSHAGAPLPGGELSWQVFDSDGVCYAAGIQQVSGPLSAARPQIVGHIGFNAPDSGSALPMRIDTILKAAQPVHNTWPLWVFPAVTAWPEGVGLADPSGWLAGLDDLYDHARQFTSQGNGRSTCVLLASVLDKDVLDFLRGGGAVLLLQNGHSPLRLDPSGAKRSR
jgi:hypothetical protein